MFSIFASQGIYHEPYMIVWVKDKYGKKVWKHSPVSEQILDARAVGQVAKVLEFGINRMRAVYKKPLVDSDVICKTGTTNEWRTCWFAGATPEISTLVYIGCDDNQSLGADVYPLKTAFPIWLSLHENLHPTQKSFSYDVRLRQETIHDVQGRRVMPDDPHAVKIMKLR
jgi:penicillin-binding protein 1A